MAYIPWENAIAKAAADETKPRKMNPKEIEDAVRDLVAQPFDPATFPFDLITLHNASPVTVARLRSGTTNKAREPGDVLWPKYLFFRPVEPGADPRAAGAALVADPLTKRHKPRFILVTDGREIQMRDLKLDETETVEFEKLHEKAPFLWPLAGFERRALVEEHPADIKAAKKLKKLYDALLAANLTWSTGHHTHELNLLMTRLLFCLYAEDTGILETPQIFTSTLTQQTAEDGADVAPLLDRLFRVMNVEESNRPPETAASERRFPYVNGSLFEQTVEIPTFNRTARRQLLECGDLDWTTINPDIFGSMIQTIAQDGTRSEIGMHYTSVPNILKVLQPLFMDELEDVFEKSKDSVPKLEALLLRLSRIRVFDPACGSGNFLIISYKALRELETRVLLRIGVISPNAPLRLSGVVLENFFGIDIVDFACETTKLSLWIAEHQSNVAFQAIFGVARPVLPLARITTIRCANALRVDWAEVCPPVAGAETYLCANPPYQTFQDHTVEQKAEIAALFASITRTHQALNYVACWFVKMADYIATFDGSSGALVATNSVVQGEHVPILWPYILARGLVIRFAYTSFRWANSAAHNAGVTCVIVGLGRPTQVPKRLFASDHVIATANINPYLAPSAASLIVNAEPSPINDFPEMYVGNEAYDGGHLILTADERRELLASHPEAEPLVRPFLGTKQFVDGLERYVLWIADEHLTLAMSIPPVARRIEEVRLSRLEGGKKARASAKRPHRFTYVTYTGEPALLVPQVSSERRRYLQIGAMDERVIISNLAFAVYAPPQYLFGILSSRLHRLWVSTIGGRMDNRLRYNISLSYNTFPVPALSQEQRRILGERARDILRARAQHPTKTIAELYDPDEMPANLLAAHEDNDAFIEEHVYGRRFVDDTQRLETLFALYERATNARERERSLLSAI